MSEKQASSQSERQVLTAATLKKLSEVSKANVANLIGRGMKIGEVIEKVLNIYKTEYTFAEDLDDEQAMSIIREGLRTCNPNDKKFNVKKYGAAYREGRLACLHEIGGGVLRAFGTHIKNLNFALEKATFNFNTGLTPKEYASLTKDLVTAVSLYKEIAQSYQPDSETQFDVLPAQDSVLLLAEIEAEALPTSEAPKALPDSSQETDPDSAEVSES